MDIHRAFQKDLCKLRLSTARSYVKTLTDGQMVRRPLAVLSMLCCAVCAMMPFVHDGSLMTALLKLCGRGQIRTLHFCIYATVPCALTSRSNCGTAVGTGRDQRRRQQLGQGVRHPHSRRGQRVRDAVCTAACRRFLMTNDSLYMSLRQIGAEVSLAGGAAKRVYGSSVRHHAVLLLRPQEVFRDRCQWVSPGRGLPCARAVTGEKAPYCMYNHLCHTDFSCLAHRYDRAPNTLWS